MSLRTASIGSENANAANLLEDGIETCPACGEAALIIHPRPRLKWPVGSETVLQEGRTGFLGFK